jgi:hypothetical protein
MGRGPHAGSIDQKIMARINGRGHGHVFTPADFLDLGSRAAVDQALSRDARAGKIRKLSHGLYDYPRRDPRLGLLSPSTDDIAKALQGRDASRLQPSGAHAANVLGLSDQVPMRMVFLTDGRSRTIKIGRRTILLKKTTPRQMAATGRLSRTVIQALRWLGRHNVDDKVVSILQRRLSPRDKRDLLNDIRYAPVWVGEVMRRVAEGRSS